MPCCRHGASLARGGHGRDCDDNTTIAGSGKPQFSVRWWERVGLLEPFRTWWCRGRERTQKNSTNAEIGNDEGREVESVEWEK